MFSQVLGPISNLSVEGAPFTEKGCVRGEGPVSDIPVVFLF